MAKPVNTQIRAHTHTEEAPTGYRTITIREDMADHPLFKVYCDALAEVIDVGIAKYNGEDVPFDSQPWAREATIHGRNWLLCKAHDAINKAADKDGPKFDGRVLAAIIYLGMAARKERLDVGPY